MYNIEGERSTDITNDILITLVRTITMTIIAAADQARRLLKAGDGEGWWLG